MGTSYTAGLGIGFVFTEAQFEAPFKHEIPEESHMEDRFDERTGAKKGSVKVVDRHRRTWHVIDGKRFDDGAHELAELVAKRVGAKVARIGGYNEPGGGMMFCVNDPYAKESEGTYSFNVYPAEIPIDKDFRPQLEELRAKLKGLGLSPTTPVIRLFFSWG